MSTAKLEMLRDKLAALLCDEDLTDEKLREASEGLLPNIYDALAPPDPRKDLVARVEMVHNKGGDVVGVNIRLWGIDLGYYGCETALGHAALAEMRGAKR